MKASFIFLLILIMTIFSLHAEEPIQRGFDTSADTVYGVLVGFLALAVTSLSGFVIWVIRKMLAWLESYKLNRSQGDSERTGILNELLLEQKKSNVKLDNLAQIQTGQAGEIKEIKNDVHALKEKTELLEKDVFGLKSSIEKK